MSRCLSRWARCSSGVYSGRCRPGAGTCAERRRHSGCAHRPTLRQRLTPALAPEGTVLITGGTGTLGVLVARHLVARHGVRHLLLCSRTGRADALRQELEAAGACVTVASCDVSDRGALRALLAGIGCAHPLTAVIHTAGVIDDGVFAAMSPQRIDKVFAAKVDAALSLHELTKDQGLAAFVLFSSASGVLGAAGQANYAAANTLLDALAHHRRAHGLPGCSLAWGYWAQRSGLTEQLGAADTARLSRGGIAELSSDDGLGLLDMALGAGVPLLVPARLDARSLSAAGASLPPLLRGLVRVTSGGSRAAASVLKQRLAGLPGAERERLLLDLVRSTSATVLSAALDSVEAERPLKELGLDSLTAVELRNRLGAATGLRLPATLLFDYPTPRALAGGCRAACWAAAAAAASQAMCRARRASRWRSWGWAAGSPAGADTRRSCGSCCRGGTRSRGSRRTGAGTWRRCTTLTPRRRARVTCGGAGSCMRRRSSTRGSSGSARGRRWRWTRSSGCCWRCRWEALERAGIDPASLRGSRTGVFVGVMYSGYDARALRAPAGLEGYLVTGNATSVVSGRVSYMLGLEGPAVTVDTACSSSLVALHLACQALRAGECELALAGGVTVMATPGAFVGFSRQRGLAARRAVQGVLGAGGRHGLGRRGRDAGAGAAVAMRGATGTGCWRWCAGSAVNQDGRIQRADRAERPVAAAGDPGGAGQRGAVGR